MNTETKNPPNIDWKSLIHWEGVPPEYTQADVVVIFRDPNTKHKTCYGDAPLYSEPRPKPQVLINGILVPLGHSDLPIEGEFYVPDISIPPLCRQISRHLITRTSRLHLEGRRMIYDTAEEAIAYSIALLAGTPPVTGVPS